MKELVQALRDLQRHEHADFTWAILQADGSGNATIQQHDQDEKELVNWGAAHEAVPAIRRHLNLPPTKAQAADAFKRLRCRSCIDFRNDTEGFNDFNTVKRFFNQDSPD